MISCHRIRPKCLKLLKAIKVVEKVLKAFLKAMTYYQMTNFHASDTCWEDGDRRTTFLLKLHICSYLIYDGSQSSFTFVISNQ